MDFLVQGNMHLGIIFVISAIYSQSSWAEVCYKRRFVSHKNEYQLTTIDCGHYKCCGEFNHQFCCASPENFNFGMRISMIIFVALLLIGTCIGCITCLWHCQRKKEHQGAVLVPTQGCPPQSYPPGPPQSYPPGLPQSYPPGPLQAYAQGPPGPPSGTGVNPPGVHWQSPPPTIQYGVTPSAYAPTTTSESPVT